MTHILPYRAGLRLAPSLVLGCALIALACNGGEPAADDTPPTVTIIAPVEGSSFTQGLDVDFVGSGEDPEDGTLTGSSLGWRSSIDGPLGQGPSLTRNDLSTGSHEIRLTGVDRANNIQHAFVDISVQPPNDPPSATISAPADGSVFVAGETVVFSGSGTDPEDGTLPGAALTWSSDVDGELGVGTSVSRSDLSAGNHVVTLTARDSRGATGTAQISITVEEPEGNQPPSATITAPADGASFQGGDAIQFTGSGTDPEDGNLSGGSLVWTSSINGQFGTGESVTVSTLTDGTHTITLTATDGDGASGSATISITVTGGNEAPNATISDPPDNSSFDEGDDITFTGSADDPEDGTLSGGSLVWTSSIDDQFGTGGSVTVSTLSAGTHTITLTATDSDGATGTDAISITVTGVNEAPSATITAPSNGDSFNEGDDITFTGEGSDPEDGDLSGTDLVWTSDLDGQLGTGESVTSTLSAGTHTITLTATDSEGATGTASIEITVVAAVSFENDIVPMFRLEEFRLNGGACTGCHASGGAAPDFATSSTIDEIHAELTDPNLNGGTGTARVLPNDTTKGDLLCKITHGSIDGSTASSCDIPGGGDMEMIETAIELIKQWIMQGALNN